MASFERARRALVLLLAMLWSVGAMAQVVSTHDYRPNEVLVKYKEGIRRNRAMMEQLYSAAGVVKVKRFDGRLRQFEQLFINDELDVKEAISTIEKSPAVEYAQPNYILTALPIAKRDARKPSEDGGIPCIPGMEIPGCTPMPCIIPGWPPGCEGDGGGGGGGGGGGDGSRPPVADKPEDVNPPVADPNLSKAYGIAKIGANEAWVTTTGKSEMVVAVIDTGIDYNHEDLSFNMWRNPNPKKDDLVGYDFIHDDGLPFDDHSHGTHCAGVIGAVGGNGKGISGVNQRVSVMALKFLSAEGSGDTAGAIRAIGYAVENGAKVLSNSWGGRGDDDNKGLRDAVQLAEDNDVLFIAAAGNDGTNNDKDPVYPAAFNAPNMISVAATDQDDDLAYFSNTGKESVHLGAPGVDVYSTVPGNGYQTMSGTSMACPHVAGAAALLWSRNPRMTHKEVKAHLLESVDQIAVLKNKTVTGGRLNIGAAIKRVN